MLGVDCALHQGQCDLVVGISPAIAQVDLAGSVTNSALSQLLCWSAPGGEEDQLEAAALVIGQGQLISDVNHFLDDRNHHGDVTFRRLPQHRPHVLLMLDPPCPDAGRGAGTPLNSPSRLFNFSLPCWSYLHGHALTQKALSTQNSEILDSPPRPFHSVFTSLCNSMMFLLRKLSHEHELGMIWLHAPQQEGGRRGQDTTMLELVSATLRVLLALENKVGLYAVLNYRKKFLTICQRFLFSGWVWPGWHSGCAAPADCHVLRCPCPRSLGLRSRTSSLRE